MKHLLIVNPSAGKADSTARITAEAENFFGEMGVPYEIRVSKEKGGCRAIAKEAGESGEETLLYACGGDGTLNEVASGAMGYPNLWVTVMPCGSGNDFIKQFPHPEAFFGWEGFRDMEPMKIDAMAVNDAWSINVCSAGFDARIGTSIDAYRRLPLVNGKRAYTMSILVNLFKAVSKPCRVEFPDGTAEEGKTTLVCACNGGWYGGAYNPVPEAKWDDGLIDVLVVKKVSRLTVAKVIGAYQKGNYRDFPDLITHRRVSSLRIITPEEEPVNIDGELLMSRDTTITLKPGLFRFMAPKAAMNAPVLAV